MSDADLRRIRRQAERTQTLLYDTIARSLFKMLIDQRYRDDKAAKFRIDMKFRSHGIQFDERDDFSMWINMIPQSSAQIICSLDSMSWFELREVPYFIESFIDLYDQFDLKIF